MTCTLASSQEGGLRNIYEVLREKEDAIERVRHEVEALRTVAPLLADEIFDLDPEIRARLVEATERDSKPGRAAKISHKLKRLAGRR